MFWILQDYQGRALEYVDKLLAEHGENAGAELISICALISVQPFKVAD